MLTESQEKAINETGKNIIVSAGAGSGKTMVLSKRVELVNILCVQRKARQ